MEPRIALINDKKLVGQRLKMSFSNYRISELWRNFGPMREAIKNIVTNDLISLTVYQPTHFKDFQPTNEFEKWATVEVTDYTNIPSSMETFDLQGGLYAVFDYKGLNTDNSIFKYIFEIWLPRSKFKLDTRPHFEVLGYKYRNNDPNSEEEICIPIKRK